MIEQLEPDDVASVMDSLRDRRAAATGGRARHGRTPGGPESDHAKRLELDRDRLARRRRAMPRTDRRALDEAHLIEAATRHYIDGALEVLSAEGHRAVYLTAVTDEECPQGSRAGDRRSRQHRRQARCRRARCAGEGHRVQGLHRRGQRGARLEQRCGERKYVPNGCARGPPSR
jgi:hypothetical protein